jgi:hypothetical protein
MNSIVKAVVAVWVFYIPFCSAPIIQTVQVNDIKKYVAGSDPRKTVILFDMDDVIGVPSKKDFTLVEEGIVPLIQELQANNYYCCVLTARPGWGCTISRNQLAKKGIDFSKSTPFKNCVYQAGAVEHHDGVAAVGKLPKGTFLKYLLEEHKDLGIENVIFIDDKYYNLSDVEQALLSLNITNFTGLHYTRITMTDAYKTRNRRATDSTRSVKKTRTARAH